MLRLFFLALIVLSAGVDTLGSAAAPAVAARAHALAMHGDPKEPAGFDHFPYANPEAPQGGRVTLGLNGSFDSLNPLIVRGVPAAGVREFVVESLMVRGYDEPFTLYGLIAESVEVPPDRSAITFHLNPKARFSDGAPITADDVLFSFEVLKAKGRPNHRAYFAKVKRVERLSDHAARFEFDAEGDREIPLILGLMPVLPRHLMSAETFDRTTLEPLVGSGPYRIAAVEPGRSITYTRDPNYWGRDLAVNRGRFNFGEVRFEYYRESSALFEAFRSGHIDLRPEDDPGRWAEGYDMPAVADGRILKKEFETGLPAGMNALAFNTRRPVFQDPRVRRALIALFDFEWINRSLYHGLFKRTQSYFERSQLSSAGVPASPRELELLAPYREHVRPEILAGTYRFPASDGSGHNRAGLREALELLRQAGYELDGGRLVAKATGQQLGFEILATGAIEERVLLSFAADVAKLGVDARVRMVDSAQYQARLKTYDYDMIQTTWPASLSPGNEQLFRWSSQAARTEGTFNYAGVADPAVDAMIAAMLAAEQPEDFVAAVRALDRVLLSGDYVIPLFHLPRQWVAHWHYMKHPARIPLTGYNLDTWWRQDGG
jgi:peptide/nickel transport system substrate-binding protein